MKRKNKKGISEKEISLVVFKKAFLTCLFLFSFFVFSAKAYAATYYVTNAGNDNCDGTSQTIGSSGHCAWQTISKVNAQTFQPGDSIKFNKGDTWREQLNVPSSGNANDYISFAAYGSGNDPIILGSTNISGGQGGYTWTRHGATNEWYLKKNAGNPSLASPMGYVWVDNTAYLSGTLGSLAASKWAYGDEDTLGYNTIYIYSTTDPSSKSIEASYRNSAITVSTHSYINLSNFTIHYTGDTDTTRYYRYGGIYITGTSAYVTATDCVSTYNHMGLNTWSNPQSVSNITVIGGQYNYNYTQGMYFMRINTVALNNVDISHNGRNGIDYGNDTGAYTGTLTITGGTISNNTAKGLKTDYIGGVTISGLTASSNTNANVNINNLTGNASISNSTFNSSSSYGFYGVNIFTGTLTIDNLTASSNYTDNIEITQCTASINVKNTTANNSVTNRGIAIDGNSPASSISVSNNTVKGNLRNGIAVNETTGGTVNISDNDIEDNGYNGDGDGILIELTPTKGATSTVIENNTLINNGGAGGYLLGAIWVDGLSNGIIRHNYISGNYAAGVYVTNASNTTVSNDSIYQNVIYNTRGIDTNRAGIVLRPNNGYPFSDMKIYNNSIYGSTGSGIHLWNSNSGFTGNVIIKNNICSNATVGDLVVDTGTVSGTETIDYNLYYSPSVTNDFKWLGTSYDFSGYKSASSHDTHSLNVDPKFVSTSTPTLSLQNISPAINAGTNVSLTTDYSGNTVPSGPSPDMGAYEFQDSTVPTTSASLSDGTYTGEQSLTLTCSDGSGVGCKKTYYTTDGTTPTTSSSQYSSPISISRTSTIKYFSRDNNNNDEAVKTGSFNISYVPGKFNTPDVSADKKDKLEDTIHVNKKRIKLSGHDNSIINGIVKIFKKNKLWKTIAADSKGYWKENISLTNGFEGILKIRHYDRYGTLMATKKAKLEVDTTKPEFTSFFWPLKSVTPELTKLTWEATDNEKISRYKIYLGGKVYTVWDNYFQIPREAPRGLQTISVRAYDKAGNSTKRTSYIRIN